MNRKRKLVYKIKQKDLKIIDGWPFVYWVGEKVLDIFKHSKPLRELADPKVGLQTGENEKFLRFFWEVDPRDIKNLNWAGYMKGGDFCRWLGNQDIVICWSEKAQNEIKNSSKARLNYLSSYFSSGDNSLLFKEGITYTFLGTKGFNVRYMPSGFIFDVAGSSIFLENKALPQLLGFLLSKCCSYFLSVVNPTVNFQVGDIARLPIMAAFGETMSRLVEGSLLSKKGILKRYFIGPQFEQTAVNYGVEIANGASIISSYRTFLNHKESLLTNLHTYEGLVDYEVFKLYGIDGEDLVQILEEQGVPPAWYPILDGYAEIPEDMLLEAKEFLHGGREKMLKELKIEGFIPEKPKLPLYKLKERFKKLYLGEEKPNVNQATEDYIEDIAIDLEINPVSVLALRKEMDLVNPSDYKHEAESFLTYHLIEKLKEDQDGIIPITPIPGHETALEHLRRRLEMVFGEEKAYDIEQEMHEPLEKILEKWPEKDFFRKHIKQYKKRPIVWQIESPKGNLKIFFYYHKLTADTLNKLKTIYLWKLRDGLSYRLEELGLEAKDPAVQLPKTFYQELEALEEKLEDLREFEKRLDAVIQSGYNPDIDDGVRVNIAPLQLAGILAAPVLVESDAKKAINDLKEWKKSRIGLKEI